jgi:hypothetical protein
LGTSLNLLSSGIAEQFGPTNIIFYQDENTLYIIGGYAFQQLLKIILHLTNLTSVDVPNLSTAVIGA